MTPDPITSSPVLSLTPQTLNDLWQSDDGVRVGLLMGVLSDDEKADLSVRYWNWLNRHDIPLAQVRDSFRVVHWWYSGVEGSRVIGACDILDRIKDLLDYGNETENLSVAVAHLLTVLDAPVTVDETLLNA